MLYGVLNLVIIIAALLALASTVASAVGYIRFRRLQAAVARQPVSGAADLYYSRALFLHHKQCFAAAIADYSKTLALQQDHQVAGINRDRALARQKPHVGEEDQPRQTTPVDEPSGIEETKPTAFDPPVVTENSDQPPDYINRGISQAQKGHIEAALADFNRAIDQDLDSAAAHMNRGIAYARENNYAMALQDFNRAAELNPKNATIYLNRGILKAKNAEFTAAVEDLSKAIELNPKHTVAFKKRGEAYIRQNLFDKGIADFSQAIRLKPKYADVYISRGRAYAQMGRHSEARSDFEVALNIKPDIARLYFQRGMYHQKMSETRQALESLKISCDLGYEAGCAEYKKIRAMAKG
jgi:tetratricopeptide (TPR) repeat protein